MKNKNERNSRSVLYLNKKVSEYQGDNAKALSQLKELYPRFQAKDKELKELIERKVEKKQDLDRIMVNITAQYGTSGSNLIKILINLKRFPVLMSNEHFAPLASILQSMPIFSFNFIHQISTTFDYRNQIDFQIGCLETRDDSKSQVRVGHQPDHR